MSDSDLCRTLAALVLLLVAAHLVGRLFGRLRLPPVVGEILGGLLLGPTLLGVLAPGAVEWLFPATGPPAAAIGLVYQLGMLLLMFLAGVEMRTVFSRESRRAVTVIAVTGMVIPFLFGLLYARTADMSRLLGEAGSVPALTLVIAVAVAVTSIPVISRIMMDLGIMNTPFARIVLSVAVLEDVVLNVVLAVALGMVNRGDEGGFGAIQLLGIESQTGSTIYHAIVTLIFLVLAMAAAGYYKRRAALATPARYGLAGTVAVRMALLLGVASICIVLGITPILGTFVVGLLTAQRGEAAEKPDIAAIRTFSAAFFIPIYFAVVGVRLDLVNAFDPLLTLGFIVFACLVKAGSVYLGARMVGNRRLGAVNLSVAMNARGGPGIVLATVAYDAGIVNETFFTTLVLTAVVTSLIAGWWLSAVVSRNMFPGTGEADNEPSSLPRQPRAAESGPSALSRKEE